MNCRVEIRARAWLGACALTLACACTQEMTNQLHYEALEASDLFPDGGSARPEVAGTVPYGRLAPERMPAGPPTRARLERGRRLYAIHCTPCHGRLGDGDGMVVRQGFVRPRALTAPALLQASDERLYAAVTHGKGVMAGYARLLDAEQRWAITQWIRVLQLSQHAPVEQLGPQDLAALAEAGA